MPKATGDETTTSKRYRVKAPKDWPADQPPFGIDYAVGGKQVRIEAGEIADGLPARSVPWLLEAGLLEEVR